MFLLVPAYPGCPGSKAVERSLLLLLLLLRPEFMSYTRHVADFTVGERRLCFFGHVMARADPKQDHHPVIGASLQPPSHWRRPCGRRRNSWLRATDTDVQSVNIGIHSACRKASDLTLWQRIVNTAKLRRGHATLEAEVRFRGRCSRR